MKYDACMTSCNIFSSVLFFVWRRWNLRAALTSSPLNHQKLLLSAKFSSGTGRAITLNNPQQSCGVLLHMLREQCWQTRCSYSSCPDAVTLINRHRPWVEGDCV